MLWYPTLATKTKTSRRWGTQVFLVSAALVPLMHDRSRTGGAHCPLAGGQGGIQATGTGTRPGRGPGTAPAAGAIGAADRPRRPGQAGPRDVEHSPQANRGVP